MKKEYPDKTEYYNDQGELHRLDGPAVEWNSGSKSWWINGQLHRLDGPACEWNYGDKSWWINNKRHREDGPAVEFKTGYKEWWINGIEYSEEEYQTELIKLKLNRIKDL